MMGNWGVSMGLYAFGRCRCAVAATLGIVFATGIVSRAEAATATAEPPPAITEAEAASRIAAALETLASLAADAGSSSRQARRQAIEALPLEKLSAPHRQTVEASVRGTTLYRRLPVETFACDPDLLAFSLQKPEAIVDIWKVLGISRLSLDPAGPGQWRLADGYGTVGVVRLLHHERQGSGGLLLFHGRGVYAGPLSPKNLSGSCVILLRHREVEPMVDGRSRQAVQVDAFLDMEGLGLEIVTRTLQPLIVRSAAANLHEICLFMASLSEAAAANPRGVAVLAARLPRTDAADRGRLAALAAATAARQGRLTQESATDADGLQMDLAARWLPAGELDRLQQR